MTRFLFQTAYKDDEFADDIVVIADIDPDLIRRLHKVCLDNNIEQAGVKIEDVYIPNEEWLDYALAFDDENDYRIPDDLIISFGDWPSGPELHVYNDGDFHLQYDVNGTIYETHILNLAALEGLSVLPQEEE